LRKFYAILLLAVLAWSQYAKQIIYLECKVSNTFRSFAVKCDCEKKAGFDKSDANSLPSSKSHSHTHPDKLYPVTKAVTPDFSIINNTISTGHLLHEDACEGSYCKPFQPPRIG
jgi:hypothetical protein